MNPHTIQSTEAAYAACRAIRFAVANAARHGGAYNLPDIEAAALLADEAINPLTPKERHALRLVGDGCDVKHLALMMALRAVKDRFPEYLWIGKPMGAPAKDQHYNCGAKLTAAGKAAVAPRKRQKKGGAL